MAGVLVHLVALPEPLEQTHFEFLRSAARVIVRGVYERSKLLMIYYRQ